MLYPVRFGLAYLTLGCLGVFAVAVFAAVVSGRVAFPKPAPTKLEKRCADARCAQVGDELTVSVTGRVVSVDESQPGARCVMVQHQGQTEATAAQRCVAK